MKKLLVIALALCMVFGLHSAIAEEPDREVASSSYGWVLSPATQDENHNITVEIAEAGTFEHKTITTAYPLDGYNAVSDVYRADSIERLLSFKDTFVEIMYNKAGEIIDLEVIEKTGNARNQDGNYMYYFDSARYGGELTAPGGGPGRMVAQGWVLAKDMENRTITIGDGNHVTYVFEETYNLADDAKIYLVDNSYMNTGTSVQGTWEGTEATMDDIIVTAVEGEDGQCPGEIYYVPEKYTALVIFDGNYTTYETALVTEVYMFKNPFTQMAPGSVDSTVPSAGEAVAARPDNMQYNGTSWMPAVNKTIEKHSYGYNGSVTPIEMMKDRLYFVGDSYTGCYLFVADNGDTTLLDMGNETATYQYWLNVAKVGYDPREVDHLVLTHGHGDHYQALYEYVTMLNRYQVGQGNINRWEQKVDVETAYENATGYGYLGYPELGPELSDASIRYVLTGWSMWYNWRSLGDGVDMYPVGSTGHSKDSPAFGFVLTAKEGDEYFEPGTKVGFVYNGAYGAKSKLNAGYQRLAMNYGLQYVQQVLAPYIASMSDYVYYMPQHMNHYPITEIAECARRIGVPIMSVYTEGVANIQNVMEKRIAVNFYEKYDEAFHSEEGDQISQLLQAAGGFSAQTSSTSFETQQKYGPYKRAEGTYELEVLNVQIIQGTDAWQNKNEAFRGITNIYGYDMADGFLSGIDAHVHDPETYYVQISTHVHDDYEGKVDFETNFYGAENYASEWTSGPVETANTPVDNVESWFEILRTTPTDYETAQQIYNTITEGGIYNVNMLITSEIVIAEDPLQTFIPAE